MKNILINRHGLPEGVRAAVLNAGRRQPKHEIGALAHDAFLPAAWTRIRMRTRRLYQRSNSMLLAQAAANSTTIVTQTGIGLGSVIAVVCSWQRNRSILWAILAGILSWLYVIYFALTRQPDETK
jgi:hypothetical protein